MMQQIMFVNVLPLWLPVVVLQIHAIVELVNVVLPRPAVIQEKHVNLEHVSAERHPLVLVQHPEHTVMPQITYANVRLLLMLVVERQIPATVELVNAVQPLHAVIQEKLVNQVLVNVERLQLVLALQLLLTATHQITSANVLHP